MSGYLARLQVFLVRTTTKVTALEVSATPSSKPKSFSRAME
jgi:hypothetical protein